MAKYSIGRRDGNEREIIDALEDMGCKVWQLCDKEPADLLVFLKGCHGEHGVRYARQDFYKLLEVKDPSKPKADRQLTDKQKKTHLEWPIIVVETVEQALQAVRGGV